ncbi:serine/threonine-protein kinase LMTK1 isoform 1 [Homo sapiens]|uniref:Serine/threonine-protein kinase LMTK1 n=2 Tax=Homo sapiens TaxID=9606 RepID=LMTK1_HUMAN|nr:serine/threonine-protein kinase LMTK1 isoform 1 [Homo sapiens]Q6ZMQ8.2 RecName: Full=Serine/threonine-protein kinase LMTK1; AltName: Full=Apoptosis-associated tyrosine kinase; Short=AATYK; AltName: Full=Brain apoptosis-associated tyrosine kinase; AltName: Full=CDK5-binding protein; AltName: Full=Lemur tyrosine kinase 1; AltName: Full=p35-binding protein; Short=p35BP [Homo sapiens]KAI2585569.1 apoptosis associated tyrosine kinase [Homo sapiens]|eukprot:NP_001073864.2 serine/threonine-protein kinase LMTK1 isoform 1 [Homo sapiens]
MSSSFFNPSFAFSSHFDPDGAPLSELSWPSSLAVVAVSFSGLFAVIVLMLACLCCKKGGIGFKEFENAEGDEYAADLAQGSPATAAQNGPDVYVLPLTEVSLPMAKQPGRSVQLLKSTDVGRHSLLYLKEIGRGWFGKVFLGEVNSGISSAQVVVKELQASASVQEQMQFLEEVQPYRALKHSNLLQCLAQCAEVTPYLLVMEFCPLGDLKGYLRSCRVAESMAPDPRTLQRMACEVACGVLHLHRNNFVHSDLALRNCLLTADLTVKIGDYGLAHCKYREDYFVTADQLWVPLRWIAPELVDEVHSNLLVVDQTKSGNVWSLGVTIWELFELGTQPYPQHSDQQVLAYTVREQQLKLPKPQLQLTLSDRWYEVMQFCWLQPEQRPTAEEVHLLLSYLCAKGATEAEEEFERRWRSLRPGGGGVGPGPGAAGPMLGGVVELAAASSFPLLEQFAGDGFHADGDDVLTVTETSRGLNFEYKWEAGRGAEAFPATLSPGRTARLQELCAPDGAPPGVVPVLSAHSPSLGSEYFIRLEEAAPAAGHDPDCAGCAPSPPATADQDDDSDGSTAASLAMEPLLGHGPPVDVPWGRGDHYPRRSLARDPLCPSRSPSPSAGPLSLAEGGAEDADWGVAAFCPAFFEDPLGTSPLGSSGAPPLPLTGEDELEEVGARRAAQRGHWRSNVSANNNSGSRCPESWDPVSAGGHAEGCPSPKQTPRASPEPGYPGEPLLGLQAASAQEPGCCPGLPHLCSAQGLAPAPCLVTPSWTETASSGGDHPQAEPKLATEAEGTTGPRLPLPSVPSPSQEGAPLPSEEASAPDAPDALPDSPTPATGGEVSAIKLASALNGSSSSPEVEAPSSEDEDTAEATSGIFTDTSSDGLQARRPDVVPAFRSLQKQVGTPDSLDSLDIPSSASDGGYEVFSPSATGPSGGQPRALDSGYDTENYESPEFVLKEAQEGCEPQAFAELASEGEGPGPETRLSTSLSGLNEKNPYRDSAYFSDLEAEAEATSGPEKKCGGDRAPGPELGLPSTGQPSEQVCLRPGVSGEAQGSGPGEVLPPLLQLEGSSPEPSTCPSGLVPEPPEPQGPAKVRPGPSPSCSQFFLLTPVPLRSEGNSSEFQGPPGLLSGPAPQKRMGGPGTPRAPLRLALPGLPAALEGRPEEEEEDSEDSDESDEELRCYSVQEPSEDSEEEAPAVPVVVAESQSARNLRSLLKMPSLLSETFCEDLERKKKAVSFFDDVTVYLFDQESPTRELGEPFPGAKESPPTFLRGSPGSPSAPNRPQQADGSPNGSTAEEGGGFAWDDDFPLMTAKAAFAMALDPAAPAPAAPTPTPAPFSRFTVSPAPTSRFSITHVSDSDAESKRGPEAGAGGESKEA